MPAPPAGVIAEECQGMESHRDFVLERVRAGAGFIGLHPATDEDSLTA